MSSHFSNVSKVTSLWGHSVVLWRLWLLVVTDRGTKGQGHLLSCSGQLKRKNRQIWRCVFTCAWKFFPALLFQCIFVLFMKLSPKNVNTSILPVSTNLQGIPNFPHVAPHNRRGKGFSANFNFTFLPPNSTAEQSQRIHFRVLQKQPTWENRWVQKFVAIHWFFLHI